MVIVYLNFMRLSTVCLILLRFSELHKKEGVVLFWNRFYDLCVKRGTKPNPVAKEIGISSGTLTKWKSAGTLPNGETLIKIADYLDCSVDYLLGRTDYPRLVIKIAPPESGADEYTKNMDAPDLTIEEIRELREFLQERNPKGERKHDRPGF